MVRNDFSGTGKVFSFTLVQYLKTKSTIVTMLALTLVSLGSLLVAAFSMDSSGGAMAADAAAYGVNVMALSDYMNPSGTSFEAGFTVTYVYGVIVLILVMLSSSYIIRSVVEEKASRLVESLMLSISPLALILGKILACLCLVLIQLAMLAVGGALAAIISKEFLTGTSLMGMISATGALSALKNLNGFTALAVVISIGLGYVTFAEIAAISSACCDRMEDINSATTAVLLPAMAGYLLGCMAPAFEGAAAVVMSILPFAGIFIAPAKYIMGEISVLVLLISWILQAGVALGLAIFGKKVYSAIIIHRGERIKLRALLGMAKGGAK